jgi:hypothetical protein
MNNNHIPPNTSVVQPSPDLANEGGSNAGRTQLATPETFANKVESDRDTTATSNFEKAGSSAGGSPGRAPEAGRAQGRSTKTGPAEPKKKQTEFSVAEEDWAKTVPKPGHYAATVVTASIDLRSRVTYLYIDYAFKDDTGRRFTLPDYPLVLDAPLHNRLYSRSAQGKGRVNAIMEANGRPIRFTTIQDVPTALIGCRVTIAVGRRDVDGLPVPCIQGIVGPAEPDEDEEP